MLRKIKKINQIKNKATVFIDKAKNTTARMMHKQNIDEETLIEDTPEPVVQSENSQLIDFFCLFASKYQHRWTKAKQSIIEHYCQNDNDHKYFEQVRHLNEQISPTFDPEHIKFLFSEIRIMNTTHSFDHWLTLQQKIVTDVLHLFALSGCTAEELQRESLALSSAFAVPESVCQQAFLLQQTAQNNNEKPYC